MFTIREFNCSDSDYKALLAVNNAAWPDEPTTLEILKFNEESRNMDFLRQRFLVEAIDNDGQPKVVAECGTWEFSGSHILGKYGVGLDIHPDYGGCGLEEQMVNHLIAFLNQREPKPVILDTFMREEKTKQSGFNSMSNVGLTSLCARTNQLSTSLTLIFFALAGPLTK